ncbi:hypothetical protein [Aeromonas hydrophila]|uniref:hypothetical protein n=1 Tax=Aeromonas hydrophila TaxID=644 RepID=UPI002366BEDA|nr:hypothetical protein [Aeromonas hydrophila]WDF91554.1 hypothetical protein PUB83_04585 [Aeromonas hydrophila subsp. hydrophila]
MFISVSAHSVKKYLTTMGEGGHSQLKYIAPALFLIWDTCHLAVFFMVDIGDGASLLRCLFFSSGTHNPDIHLYRSRHVQWLKNIGRHLAMRYHCADE